MHPQRHVLQRIAPVPTERSQDVTSIQSAKYPPAHAVLEGIPSTMGPVLLRITRLTLPMEDRVNSSVAPAVTDRLQALSTTLHAA